MYSYLLKFSACLLVFWLIYIIVLEKQKMHQFKRFYLLFAIALSIVIPQLTIKEYLEPVVTDLKTIPVFSPLETTSVTKMPIEQPALIDLETTLWFIYGLGLSLFLLRFVINLIKLYRLISQNENISRQAFIYVLLKEYRIPHSFFKYIFLNKLKFDNNTIPKEVMFHEETHAKQLHSLDIVIIELVQIVFWFHPLIYVLKHHIKLNHEFLADEAVLNNGVNTKTYQTILLQFSSNTQNHQLSSAINYSSIKKRFTVMKTQTSKTRIWASSLLLLPIIAILFYSFAEKECIETDYLSSNLSEVSKSQLSKVKKYREATNRYNQAVRLFINDKRYIDDQEARYLKSVADDLFKSFSHKEKTQFNIFKTRPIPYSDEKATDLFYYNEPVLRIDSEQNLWLNNKKTTLETLEEDFNSIIKFAGTGVRLKTENSVSVDLVEKIMPALGSNLSVLAFSPKEATVYDSNYKQEKATEKEVEAYNIWANQIHSESKVLSEDATWYPPINEQDLIKFSKIYKRMSAQQKKQAVEYPFPGLDVNDSGQYISISPTTNQQKATEKQIAAYNSWAKAINEKMSKAKANNDVNEYPIVKVKEVNKYKAIYAIMTEAQKKVAEPWPSFPPPPPPPPIPENSKGKSGPIEINGATYYFTQQKGKTTYYDQYGKVVDINKVPPPPPILANATPEQKAKMEIATTSNKKAQKASAKVADEITGYTEINGENIYYVSKNGITNYFDKYGKEVQMDNLPPPPPSPAPPPSPESALDFVIRMAKVDTKFFNEGKSISSDEAIALLKSNPTLNVNAQKTDTRQTLVYISKKPIVIGKKGSTKN